MTITHDPPRTTPEPEPEPEKAPAPSATPTPGRFPHLRALDGLRGFAVLIVVLSHFAPGLAPGGFLGVDLFFVLSGFLITSLLVREHSERDRIALGDFWVRRARRLLPALLVVLAVVLVVTAITRPGATQHQVGLDGLASLFYVANWRFVASGQSYVMQFVSTEPSPLRHMWSLAIEEQFYLVWPLVVTVVGAVAVRLRSRLPGLTVGRLLAAICAVLALASTAWMVLLGRHGRSLDRLYYGTDTRVAMILAGATVGALTLGRPQLGRWWRTVAIAAGSVGALLLLAATAVVETTDRWLYQGGFALAAVVLCALLVGAAQEGTNPLGRVLSVRPLVGLGLISYGVYLWHWPITVWVDESTLGVGGVPLFVVRSVLTLGVSLVSYRFVEQPIRRHGLRRLGPARRFAAPFAIAALAVGCLLPVVVHPAYPPAPEGRAPASLSVGEYASAPRCDGPTAGPQPDPGRPLRYQLIGNSLAGEVRTCLTEILADRGADGYTVNPPGFLLCREAPAIEDQIREVRPDFAILFVFVAYDDRCGEPWHATVDRLIDSWIAAGTHVFLVPSVTIPEGGRTDLQPGTELERDYYAARAAADPEHITAVDGGRFLRDSSGTYLWRMPCASPDEAGCRPDGTVPIRFVDGLHFCTDADFPTLGCVKPEAAAGERRAAASIAVDVVPALAALVDGRLPVPVPAPEVAASSPPTGPSGSTGPTAG